MGEFRQLLMDDKPVHPRKDVFRENFLLMFFEREKMQHGREQDAQGFW